jgi:peptidoglycan/LPS O-acetylase OafA/YrhL
MNSISTSSKIETLQVIRGLASIAVMLAHGSSMIDEKLDYQFLNKLPILGAAGVDFFFVLSGFIIYYTSSSGKYNISSFLKKRFIRIYPIYWLVTLILIIQFFVSPNPEKAHKGELDVILMSFTLFPYENYILGVAWTLTYEVMFYLMFALTFFKNPKIFIYAFFSWMTLIFLAYAFDFKSDIFAINALVKPIILEFMLGCLVAYCYKKYAEIKPFKYFFWLGLILLMILATTSFQLRTAGLEQYNDDMFRVGFFGVPAAILIFGVLYIPAVIPKLFVLFGDASYSLYLLHGSVLSVLLKIILMLNFATMFGNPAGAIFLFAVTLFVSCLFYSLVEKNLLVFLNQRIVK